MASTKQQKYTKKIPFFEGNIILVDMPAAESSVDAAEHYHFWHKFIYVIRCDL